MCFQEEALESQLDLSKKKSESFCDYLVVEAASIMLQQEEKNP